MIAWSRCLQRALFATLLCAIPAWGQEPVAPQSLDDLKSQLQSPELEVRRQAAIATRSAKVDVLKQLLPTLIERLRNDHDGQVRLAIFATVTDMGPAAATAADALVESMRKDFGGRHN